MTVGFQKHGKFGGKSKNITENNASPDLNLVRVSKMYERFALEFNPFIPVLSGLRKTISAYVKLKRNG